MIVLGFISASFVEWWIHKYLFHGLGKKKGNIFSFHLREHHRNCLLYQNKDSRYTLREGIGILFLFFITFPLFLLSPFFYYGLVMYGILFLIVHKIIHTNVQIGKKFFPWHWDHHMKYPHHNMNVVVPIADYVLKTRKKIDK